MAVYTIASVMHGHTNIKFIDIFLKKSQISNFIKILHCQPSSMRTDRHDEANSGSTQLRTRLNNRKPYAETGSVRTWLNNNCIVCRIFMKFSIVIPYTATVSKCQLHTNSRRYGHTYIINVYDNCRVVGEMKTPCSLSWPVYQQSTGLPTGFYSRILNYKYNILLPLISITKIT